MKSKVSILLIFSFPFFLFAEPKNLNDVLSKATPQEMHDLPKLLKQIRMEPVENSLMRVTEVEKGSVYEREGIKVGDLIITNKSKAGGKKMMLKQSLKKSISKDSFKK